MDRNCWFYLIALLFLGKLLTLLSGLFPLGLRINIFANKHRFTHWHHFPWKGISVRGLSYNISHGHNANHCLEYSPTKHPSLGLLDGRDDRASHDHRNSQLNQRTSE